MYKLAYGSPPFEANPGKLAALIVSGFRPKRPATGISRGMSMFIDKCLQHDIKQRYPSAAQALNGLIRCKELFETEQQTQQAGHQSGSDASNHSQSDEGNNESTHHVMIQNMFQQIEDAEDVAKATVTSLPRHQNHARESATGDHKLRSNGSNGATAFTASDGTPVLPKMVGLAQLARAGFVLQPLVAEAKTPSRSRIRGAAVRGIDHDMCATAMHAAVGGGSSNDDDDDDDRPSASIPQKQKGSVGIVVARECPHTVLRLAGVRDEAGRLQGEHGYANEEVRKGDVLIKVNGVSVEQASIEEVWLFSTCMSMNVFPRRHV